MINADASVRQCMQSCFSEEKTDYFVIINFYLILRAALMISLQNSPLTVSQSMFAGVWWPCMMYPFPLLL